MRAAAIGAGILGCLERTVSSEPFAGKMLLERYVPATPDAEDTGGRP
jgi:hypothetical protein